MILYAGISLAAVLLASYLGSMRWLKIKHEKLYTDKDARFRVLLISDFHSNNPQKTNARLWEKIHGCEFDMVAITGDLVQDRLSELEPLKPHLRRLAERAPVYFVDGNHEKYIYTEMFAELEKLGVNVLHNRRVSIDTGLDIVGISDFYRLRRLGFPGIAELFTGGAMSGEQSLSDEQPADAKFVLVLSHQPQIIDVIAEYSPDLLLCGHTHGGQVRIPLLPALFAPGQGLLPKYDHGWYKTGDTSIFISKGIGATHFNIRLFNRPEAVVIEVGRLT